MSKKRKLTLDEIRSIRNRQLAIEQVISPGYNVVGEVLPETNDNGEPRLTVERKREIRP